ncbi:cAMP-responsive element modulator-like isoform X5 [Perca fluviatilis]|uniref:cAMP-responsive element modulator-like isoform X5 n=1 Tax=Perca fluviatilis TaxID=8168 RepID=UPI001964C20F|nr:cAMP-responsive element modulator-like isoform X5 [Perca fluviatilis]
MNRRNQSDQQPQSGPVRMNQMKTEETYQPGAYTPCIQRPVPCIQRPVYQQTSLQNQYYGVFQGAPVRPVAETTQNLSMTMTSTQTPQLRSGTLQYYCEENYCMPGTSGDMTACQLCNTSSSLPQGVANTSMGSAGASAHSDLKPGKGNLQKKELRLMKNRDSARKYRKRKKDHMDELEIRNISLERENEMLKAELQCLRPSCLYLAPRPSQLPP